MATRLQQIVSAEGVAPGATAVITHNINVGGVPWIPDRINRDNMGFAGVAATTTTISVRNDTDEEADIELYLRLYHTQDRVYGNKATLALTPDPWWDGGADSIVPASGGVVNTFVYQPGGVATGPEVFASFPLLYAALVAARVAAGGQAPMTLAYDSTYGAVTVPAGTYDFTNVTQVGTGTGQTAVAYADGTVFTAARRWKNLIVTNLNTTTSPITDITDGDHLVFDNTVVQTQTGGTIAMFRHVLTTGQAATFWFTEGSTLGGAETGRVISVANSNSQLRIKLDALSSIAVPGAISSGGFATPVMVITAPSMAQIPTAFSSWPVASGYTNPGPALPTPASLLPRPFLGTAQAGSFTVTPADHGQWLRFNASSAFQQELPAISGISDGAAGVFLLVTDEHTPSANQVTIVPAAGDTIEGSSTARGVPRSGGLLLVSNGVSRWSIVAAWGLNRMLLPYIWRQDNVTASQTDVAIAPTGTLFATFMAMRAGSVVGIMARFNANITVAGATFTVTINGVATTLVVNILDGSSSATLTAFAGESALNNYLAGDLIGVTITTTGAFAPTTADVEVVVEVEECP